MSYIIDISVGLKTNAPVYPGDRPFKFQWAHKIGASHRSNLSFVSLGSHAGTHVDAPLHFFSHGKTVGKLALESLIGSAQVIAIKNPKEITPKDLPSLKGIQRILFKTENSKRRLLEKKKFAKDFVALTPEAARLLVKSKIQLVGIDYLSIEPFGRKEPQVHWALLKAGIIIVEGLDLSKVSPGAYELICLPLKVIGAEGAPVRAVLKSY